HRWLFFLGRLHHSRQGGQAEAGNDSSKQFVGFHCLPSCMDKATRWLRKGDATATFWRLAPIRNNQKQISRRKKTGSLKPPGCRSVGWGYWRNSGVISSQVAGANGTSDR